MKQKTFESSLGELEKIVRKLEGGDLSLDESLKLFEEGIKLSRECEEKLSNAERRVELLMRDEHGGAQVRELAAEDLARESEPTVKRRIVFADDDDETETDDAF